MSLQSGLVKMFSLLSTLGAGLLITGLSNHNEQLIDVGTAVFILGGAFACLSTLLPDIQLPATSEENRALPSSYFLISDSKLVSGLAALSALGMGLFIGGTLCNDTTLTVLGGILFFLGGSIGCTISETIDRHRAETNHEQQTAIPPFYANPSASTDPIPSTVTDVPNPVTVHYRELDI